jgi:hypothetical protein
VASHHHTAAMTLSDTKKSASGVRKPIGPAPKQANRSAYLALRRRHVDPLMRPCAQLRRNTDAVI